MSDELQRRFSADLAAARGHNAGAGLDVWAIIPARAGSRRVPGKNTRPLAGLPLAAWSVRAAQESQHVKRIILSSDAISVGEAVLHALPSRLRVEFHQRPAELATDSAATDDVIRWILQSERGVPEPDLVVLLQPTVPIREAGLVDRCIRALMDADADSAFTATPLHFTWRQVWTVNGWIWHTNCVRRPPRQLMCKEELRWHEDGSVYVFKPALLRDAAGKRIGGVISVVENERTVDIDTEADFALAEVLMRSHQGGTVGREQVLGGEKSCA